MKKRRLSVFEILGILLLIAGIIAGGYYWKTTYATSPEDAKLRDEAVKIQKQWESPDPSSTTSPTAEPNAPKPTKPAPPTEQTEFKVGDVVGILHIPAWGADHAVPIIFGVDLPELERGVGMYKTSATPGKLGNLAIAGHRSGDPQPFRNLLELERGDKIIVETKIAKYTYVVTGPAYETTLTAEDGGWVVHSPEIEGFENMSTITLTTCTHLWRSNDRSVLYGKLESRELKTP